MAELTPEQVVAAGAASAAMAAAAAAASALHSAANALAALADAAAVAEYASSQLQATSTAARLFGQSGEDAGNAALEADAFFGPPGLGGLPLFFAMPNWCLETPAKRTQRKSRRQRGALRSAPNFPPPPATQEWFLEVEQARGARAGGRPSRQRERGAQLVGLTGFSAPYFTTRPGLAGYKVHVVLAGLPLTPCDLIFKWANDILGAAGAQLPDQIEIAGNGSPQMLLTFCESCDAQRAQRVLNGAAIAAAVGDAAFWVPKDYDAWKEDSRFILAAAAEARAAGRRQFH